MQPIALAYPRDAHGDAVGRVGRPVHGSVEVNRTELAILLPSPTVGEEHAPIRLALVRTHRPGHITLAFFREKSQCAEWC